MKVDIVWYVRSCHVCQVRQTAKVVIPPTVPLPAAPMLWVHVDSMDMPAPYKHFIHGRCTTTYYAEGRAVTNESTKALSNWIYQDLLCRWGALSEIISDNGAPWVKALDYVAKQYHIRHIRISGYNSRANGVVERPHFSLRDSLWKATAGDASKWTLRVHSVL